uniref:Chitin-binding type-2 domain-containing protein n=1 Tax=Skeletonema marinoi TaxID=267567 RepID=A0A7S1CRF1_9STRA|mmetsp:Transcript_1287/g.1914  ORF Transcript_1287/g.1914 Transcript_1287/m.1914 type:complete len:231 (+) Transcript_1287:381-1073(+)
MISYTRRCRHLLLGMMLSYSNADYNPDFHPNPNGNNATLLDVVGDVICSALGTGTGQQGLPDCSGFAVCESGFVMEMVQCEEGSMYDESTESCSVDKTDCDPAADEPTGKFYPNWSSKKCDEKTSSNGLGVHYGYYDSRIACCSHNFISSIDQLESCIGTTLEELYGESEEFPEGTGYVPEWGSSSSCVLHTVDGDSEAWMKDTMKSKRYECCFEYVSWDLLTCMSDASR